MSEDALGGILRELAHAPAAELPPSEIGRFKVVRPLGSGGMGVVYEAEDPTLGRRVALKLLRPDGDGSRADAAASRLLREAQALAKLSHPNVVTIYEAGRDGERVYLAMELVVGATARAWRDAAPRSAAEVLGVYRQAAIGLAAAHRAGLVHRDVKPENLLVGDDGRVRVTDFGLVAALEHGAPAPAPIHIDPGALTMTRTGAVMGTPPYMAPEAHHGRSVDARSDQWSLCVAIWEALGGARPYAATTYPELVDHICGGRRVEPPTRIADHVRAALERGLAIEPSERWPSVDALLDALTRRSRRGLALGVGALAVAGLGVGALAVVELRGGGAAAPAPADAAVLVEAPPVPFTSTGTCVSDPFFVDDQTVGATVRHGVPSDIVAIPLAGGAPTPISVLPDQNFSPIRGDHDGEIAFFHRGAKPGPGTWITRVDHGGEPHIYEGPVDFHLQAGFAIVGDAIYYVAPDVRFLHRYREGKEDVSIGELPVGTSVNRMIASRDGDHLFLGTDTSDGPCLVDLTVSPAKVECLGLGLAGGLALSRDGTALYHGSVAGGVWRLDLATRADVKVSSVATYDGLAVSSDDRTLIVSQCKQRGRVIEIGGDGVAQDRGPDELWDHAVGPDGLLVAIRQDDRGTSVVERDHAGGWRELVAPGPQPSEPVLDATGAYVAFVSVRDHGIFVAHTSPFAPERVTDRDQDATPVFLADGRIVFTRYGEDHSVHPWIVDPEGGEPVQGTARVRYVVDVDRVHDRVLVKSPDNRRLFLWDPVTDREDEIPIDGDFEIFAASLSADGRTLAMRANRLVVRMTLGASPVPTVLYENEAVAADRPIVTDDGLVRFSIWDGVGELVRVTR